MNHAAHIQQLAEELIGHAERMGVVLTITTQPNQPLAMGNHRMVAEAREARNPAQTPRYTPTANEGSEI